MFSVNDLGPRVAPVIRMKVSKRTKYLLQKKRHLRKKDKKAYKAIKAQIKESCILDFKTWVTEAVTEIEKVNGVDDVKKIFNVVNHQTCSATNLNPHPAILRWTRMETETCYNHQKIRSRDGEISSKTSPKPPLRRRYVLNWKSFRKLRADKISRVEFEAAVKRLKLNRVTGPDGVPAKVYKFCPRIKDELFGLISYMWDNEDVPPNMVTANFRMLYKNKGSREDPCSSIIRWPSIQCHTISL